MLTKPEQEAQTIMSRFPVGAFTLPIQAAIALCLRRCMSSTFGFVILVLEEYARAEPERDGQHGGMKAAFLTRVIEDIKKRFEKRLVDK